MTLLLIEDDTTLAAEIVAALGRHGYVTEHVTDGANGLQRAASGQFDLIIGDRMLPKLDGLDVIRNLRAGGDKTPVLVLSALDSVDERVRGLRAGGDDYLGKPFAVEELLARVESLLRRNRDSAVSRVARANGRPFNRACSAALTHTKPLSTATPKSAMKPTPAAPSGREPHAIRGLPPPDAARTFDNCRRDSSPWTPEGSRTLMVRARTRATMRLPRQPRKARAWRFRTGERGAWRIRHVVKTSRRTTHARA